MERLSRRIYVTEKNREGGLSVMREYRREHGTGRIHEPFYLSAAAGPAIAGGHIELWGNRRAVIEGSGGVLEYGPETIRIRLGKLCVRFCGRSLQIRCMSGSSMIVEGFISSVEYRV